VREEVRGGAAAGRGKGWDWELSSLRLKRFGGMTAVGVFVGTGGVVFEMR
jgi:hypothetical protein